MITFVLISSILYLANQSGGFILVTSNTFDTLFKSEAQKYGLNWKMLKAICMNESSLGQYPSVKHGLANPSDVEGSKSQDGKSWGIMQVTIPTARDFDPSATAEKLNNPGYSVKLAAQYLAWVVTQFKDDPRVELIVKSYNQGVGNTKKERAGLSEGFADEYWARYQRNYETIKNEV